MKVGAREDASGFLSGTLPEVAARLSLMQSDVIYLLPFFEPGFGDLHSGKDVRKGTLGSVYAVRDFFRIDPALVGDPNEADLENFVSGGLIDGFDLSDLLGGRKRERVRVPSDLLRFGSHKALIDWVGEAEWVQIIGRAQLRALTREAHRLGKRVTFDLVLQQTSRDCALIRQHPDWYDRDESGVPKINQIAWLVYSDVALLNLPFNRTLQDYLSSVAPFWIRRCDFDGVRIDASQTIDRPFLKQIKNRINAVKEDALVLGDTLCPLEDAVDVPVDIVYALLVDFHRDVDCAAPYIEFLEETYSAYAPGTVVLAYFENHDSPRASRIWRERFDDRLNTDTGLCTFWQEVTGDEAPATRMAYLKNLQASIINATAGCAGQTLFSFGTEWGSEWGEEQETDFENPTLIDDNRMKAAPGSDLVLAYGDLKRFVGETRLLRTGRIYFHRNEFTGGEAEDRILAYVRSRGKEALIVVHNLDPQWTREVTVDLVAGAGLSGKIEAERVFDSYDRLVATSAGETKVEGSMLKVRVAPLQSVMIAVREEEIVGS